MQPLETPPGEGTAAPESPRDTFAIDTVCEDPAQHGDARPGGIALFVDPDTRLQVDLPRDFLRQTDDTTGRVPFVVDVGSPGVNLHMQRAELERLHALIGRALERDAARP